MPTYAYACTACGHKFDIHQSFSDESLTVCPECAGRLRKVFSPVGVTFKGSGFYRTDSRSKSASSTGPGRSAHATESGPGSSGSSSAESGSTPAASSGSATSSPDSSGASGAGTGSTGASGSSTKGSSGTSAA